jgi:undecaprenyl phosphate-alpha-L-ara4N flippase subunit ArnF
MTAVSRTTAALLVSLSVILTSLAQLSFKSGMMAAHGASAAPSATEILVLIAEGSPAALVVGVVAYGVSMLLWIFALTRLPVSLAYPMLSLSYLAVYLVATLLPRFGETGSVTGMVGVALVMAGIGFISTGNRD